MLVIAGLDKSERVRLGELAERANTVRTCCEFDGGEERCRRGLSCKLLEARPANSPGGASISSNLIRSPCQRKSWKSSGAGGVPSRVTPWPGGTSRTESTSSFVLGLEGVLPLARTMYIPTS